MKDHRARHHPMLCAMFYVVVCRISQCKRCQFAILQYDIMIEKGVRDIPGVYRVLRAEDTKLRAASFAYMNYEEDVGVPGLRQLKESYGPARLLTKYVMTEQ